MKDDAAAETDAEALEGPAAGKFLYAKLLLKETHSALTSWTA